MPDRFLIKSIHPKANLERLCHKIKCQCRRNQPISATMAIAVGEGFVSMETFNKLSEFFKLYTHRMWWKKLQKVLDNPLYNDVFVVEFRKIETSWNNYDKLRISFHNSSRLYGYGYKVNACCKILKTGGEKVLSEGDLRLADTVLKIVNSRCCNICKKKSVFDDTTFEAYNDIAYFYDCDRSRCNIPLYGLVHKTCLERKLTKCPDKVDECPWCKKNECHRLDLSPLLEEEDEVVVPSDDDDDDESYDSEQEKPLQSGFKKRGSFVDSQSDIDFESADDSEGEKD